MGRHNYSDICKNVLTIGTAYFIQALFDQAHEEYEYDDKDEIDYDLQYGWRWTEEAMEAGKKNRLLVNGLTKVVDDKTYHVCLVNSSEYASIGEYWYHIFSDDRTAVELFRDDFKTELDQLVADGIISDLDIEDVDSLEQTL